MILHYGTGILAALFVVLASYHHQWHWFALRLVLANAAVIMAYYAGGGVFG